MLGLALASMGACTPTSRVAEPDLVMKSALSPDMLAPCIADMLGRVFGDHNPSIERQPGAYYIAFNAPRGALLGLATIEERGQGAGSTMLFYNGDLYWPDHRASGFYPDIARDNWHRAERAFDACNNGNGAG